ncbi:hypothetical protein [Streptomyces sp. NPDC056707]|uniref:hypothetical protein n=1 Tax=Streptomyces sp. NPDC056707 TaxID=3345919 RepID=UPI0036B53B68
MSDQPSTPAAESGGNGDRERDWLDDLYAEEPTAPEPKPDSSSTFWWARPKKPKTYEPEQEEPGETLRPAPSVQVTINSPAQEQPQTSDPRRSRRRRWLATHGALAGVGWYIGLGPAMADLLTSTGRSAPAVGIGLVLISTLFGMFLPGLPYVPPQLRPLVVALCRIPACTAVLALALHAPNALI